MEDGCFKHILLKTTILTSWVGERTTDPTTQTLVIEQHSIRPLATMLLVEILVPLPHVVDVPHWNFLHSTLISHSYGNLIRIKNLPRCFRKHPPSIFSGCSEAWYEDSHNSHVSSSIQNALNALGSDSFAEGFISKRGSLSHWYINGQSVLRCTSAAKPLRRQVINCPNYQEPSPWSATSLSFS